MRAPVTLLVLTGCWPYIPRPATDAPVEVDEVGDAVVLDADADADADSDTDVDTDTDSDADTDTDTDTDTDADADADADSDADVDPPDPEPCVDDTLGAPPDDVSSTTTGATNDFAPPYECSAGDGNDVVYQFVAPSTGRFAFDTLGSALDTIVYALDTCDGAVIACDDDIDLYGGLLESRISLDLTVGEVALIVVDSYANAGTYTLHVAEVSDTETTCDDGVDDDVDGFVDCFDIDCDGEPGCVDTCPDLNAAALGATLTGTTLGAPNEDQAGCDYSSGAGDQSVAFTAAKTATYQFELTAATDFDAVLYVLDGCGGAELGCDDQIGVGGELLLVDLVAGQDVVVIVDGWSGGVGDFGLKITEY